MTKPWNPSFLEIQAGGPRRLLIVFGLAAALFSLLVVLCLPNEELRWVALIIAGTPAALCWGVVYLIVRSARQRRLHIHPEGIRETRRGVERTLAFDEIEEIKVKAVQLSAAGVAGGGLIGAAAHAAVIGLNAQAWINDPIYQATAVTITLSGGGQQIIMNKWDKRWLEAYGAIRERVEPRLLAKAHADATAGGAQFGPVRVSPEGVSFSGKPAVPLAEIERVDLNVYHFMIKRRGKLLGAGSAPLQKVPNVHVLVGLLAELRGAASPAARAAS